VYKKRIIARIDVKNEFVIKGIHLEGLRKVGNPIEFAQKYYKDGIDEIIFMDAVASLYGRNNLFHIIEEACKQVFIPITIGGGIRTIQDIDSALKSGADKITLNTQAVKSPQLIKEASRIYGSQCIVGSIEAKRKDSNWEVYIDNGREETGLDVIEWAERLVDLGIGELIITSIDQEGTKQGFDMDLVDKICEKVDLPIIVSGGAGNLSHISSVINKDGISGIAIASVLHYNTLSVTEIKNKMILDEINVRI
jgi:cyclase